MKGCITVYSVVNRWLDGHVGLRMFNLKESGSYAMKKQTVAGAVPKTRITLSLPTALIERIRNIVYWTPALTLTGIVEDGIHVQLKKLEKGRRFRPRKGNIRVGRPPKNPSAKK